MSESSIRLWSVRLILGRTDQVSKKRSGEAFLGGGRGQTLVGGDEVDRAPEAIPKEKGGAELDRIRCSERMPSEQLSRGSHHLGYQLDDVKSIEVPPESCEGAIALGRGKRALSAAPGQSRGDLDFGESTGG